MANIIEVNTSNPGGARVLSALRQINGGVFDLAELDGLRAQSISAGAATFGQNFGVTDLVQAQELSDRWAAFLAWFNAEPTWIETAAQARQAFRDLLDAVTTAQ
jgi:hypothetical protein